MKSCVIMLVILFSFGSIANSKNHDSNIENVALRVGANDTFTRCVAEEALKIIFDNYSQFHAFGGSIDEGSENVFASFLILTKGDTDKFERFTVRLKSTDEDKKWFYVGATNEVYPFTHEAASQAEVKLYESNESYQSFSIASCNRI